MKIWVNKQSLKLCVYVFSILIVILIGYFAVDRLLGDTSVVPADDPGTDPAAVVINQGQQKYYEDTSLDTWLVMGIDKTQETASSFGGSNNQQNDFNMVIILNNIEKTYRVLLLNRDTMVKMDQLDISGSPYGSTVAQLALAHSYGDGAECSCVNAKNAVSGLLYGIEIDHYLSLTMEAIPIINDSVGGISLELEEDLSVLSPSWIKGTTITLLGEDSLNFVRARKSLSDSTNLSRMNRQRQYLLALFDKLQASYQNDADFCLSLFNHISPYLITDSTVTTMNAFVKDITEGEFLGTSTIEGETRYNEVAEHTEFYPDEELLKQYVLDLFCKAS